MKRKAGRGGLPGVRKKAFGKTSGVRAPFAEKETYDSTFKKKPSHKSI